MRRLLNKLANWRQLSEDLPVSGLLTRIIADSGYADYLERRSYAGENLADLESFLDWVKLLEQNQPLSINTLAGYIRNLREKDSQPEEIEPVVSVGDAVRVLTVHGSKDWNSRSYSWLDWIPPIISATATSCQSR